MKVFKVKEFIVFLKNVSDIKFKMDKLIVRFGDGLDIDYKLRFLKSVYDKLLKNVEGIIILNFNGIVIFSLNIGEDNWINMKVKIKKLIGG